MLILIDVAGVDQVAFRTSSSEFGDTRRYYCARPPARAIIVCRNGLELRDLIAQVVDVQVGCDPGWRDFVRQGNQGEVHTKITVYRRIARARPARTLSQMLALAPQDGKPRPTGAGER